MARQIQVGGESVALPDPDTIEQISSHYRDVCTTIGSANNQLRAISRDWTEWTGQAADAFAQHINELPSRLDRAWASYDHMAWALWQYGNDLRPIVSQLLSLSNRIEDERYNVEALRAAHDRAVQANDPNAASLATRLDDAQSQLDDLQRAASGLVDDMRGRSDWMVGEVQTALDRGIRNDVGSMWSRYGVQDVGATAVHIVVNVVWKSIHDLPGHIADFARHPSWDNAAKIAGDVAGILAVASLVIPGLGEALMGVALVLDVAKLGLDTAAVVSGETHDWRSVAGDVIGLATDGVGAVAIRGAKAGDEVLAEATQESETAFIGMRIAPATGEDSMAAMLKYARAEGTRQALVDGEDAAVSGRALWTAGLPHEIPFTSLTSFASHQVKSFAGFTWENMKTGFPTAWNELRHPISTGAPDFVSQFVHFGSNGLPHTLASVHMLHFSFGLNLINKEPDQVNGIQSGWWTPPDINPAVGGAGA